MRTETIPCAIPQIISSFYPGIRSGDVITLTPQIAQVLRDRHMSDQQRPLKRALVNMLVSQLKENRWILTGDTIKFDIYGKIIDGQHRIQACIISGISIQVAVFFGLAPEAYMMIDKTAGRTASDIVAGFGRKNSNVAASIARNYLIFKAGVKGHMSGSEAPKVDRDDIVNFAMEISDEIIHSAMKIDDKQIDGLSILKKAEIGLFLILFSETQGFKKAYAFLNQVCDPNEITEKDNPAHVLRNVLIKDYLSPKSVSIIQKRAWVIRAWNDYVSGFTRTIFRAVPEPGKNFPTIK